MTTRKGPADSFATGRYDRNTGLASASRISKPSAGSYEGIFNKDEFVSRNLEDLDLARDVAAIFVDHAPEYIDEICSALATGDARALVESAHKLKGAAANLALPILSDLARIVELHAKDGDLKKGAEIVPQLESRLAQAVSILQDVIIAPHRRDINEHSHC